MGFSKKEKKMFLKYSTKNMEMYGTKKFYLAKSLQLELTLVVIEFKNNSIKLQYIL